MQAGQSEQSVFCFFFGRTQELKQRQIRNTVWLYEETDVCFLSKASKHFPLGTLNKIMNLNNVFFFFYLIFDCWIISTFIEMYYIYIFGAVDNS